MPERYDFNQCVGHDDIIVINEGARADNYVITFLQGNLWIAHEDCPESSGVPMNDNELLYLNQLITDYLVWKSKEPKGERDLIERLQRDR